MSTIVTRTIKGAPLSWAEADANFTNLNTDKAEVSVVNTKAPLASPDLTGVPTTPTATSGTNTTQIASTAFTKTEIAADRPYSDTNPIMDSTAAQGTSPKVSRQDHVHPSDTTKASLSGATFTGGVSATTGLTVKAAATGSDDGNVVSGTYTPTTAQLTNITSLTVSAPFNYIRVGNIVTVSGQASGSVTASGTQTNFNLSLPFASNFSTAYQCTGTAAMYNASVSTSGNVSPSTAFDQAVVSHVSGATGTTNYFIHYTYQIV